MKKFEVVRDIQMMVRRGAFQFEEKDRPVVYVNDDRTQSSVAVRLGGVEFDDDRQVLVFSAYDKDGRFLPKEDGQSRDLSVLSGRGLEGVRDTVERYFECSLNRGQNLEFITELVREQLDDNLNLVFDIRKPQVTFEDADGRLQKVSVDEIFYPETHAGAISGDTHLFFSGRNQDGAKMNGRLFELNDMCIQNIVSSMSDNLSLDRSRKTAQAEKPAEKASRKKSNGPSL